MDCISKDCQSFGLCNFYSPNVYRDRATLWEWASNNLPNTRWIFISDFNMVEHREDKIGGNSFS